MAWVLLLVMNATFGALPSIELRFISVIILYTISYKQYETTPHNSTNSCPDQYHFLVFFLALFATLQSGRESQIMKRILFVDDDDLVLETIESMFRSTWRNEWDLSFAHSGTEALQLMENQPADVVVSDMRMPKMNGATLLNEIMHKHPKTVRFILSGYADMELVMNCVGGTHQFLSKPGDISILQSAVRRAVEMDAWLCKQRSGQNTCLPAEQPCQAYFTGLLSDPGRNCGHRKRPWKLWDPH